MNKKEMSAHPGIYVLQQNRRRIADVAVDFSSDDLWTIPEGFRNNIAWNFGHIVVTQQLLQYNNCGLPMYIDGDVVNVLRKGTSPADWNERPDMARIIAWMVEMPEKLAADYEAGRFSDYQAYKTSAGMVLRNIDEAIDFNNFHDGIHIGVILALSKLV